MNMTLPMLKIGGEGRVISSFVFQHLFSAVLFSRKVRFIEEDNFGKPFGEFFTEIRSYSSASFMASAAAIEANINELYISHGSVLRQNIHNFEEEFWGKNGIEKKPVIDKYKEALKILKINSDIKNLDEFKDADLLLKLRNTFVHFKPNWDFSPEDQKSELKTVSERCKFSQFVDDGADLISMKCMSYSCSKWGVESAIRCIDKFAEISGLQNKIEKFKNKLKLEDKEVSS